MSFDRRIPIGAEISGEQKVHFRVWAPGHRTVEVVLEEDRRRFPLRAEGEGYFSGEVEGVAAGSLYRFSIDSGELVPDPASRFQPEGQHGPSMVVNPLSFTWNDEKWNGCSIEGQIVYEMHVGTFTPEGTWLAAIEKLPLLQETGITLIEVMPVSDFPGRFGWGYDGVNLFAPTHLYGSPDEMRRFVDAAHARGIGIILDVVYNHFGPDGNFIPSFTSSYFTDKYENEWGAAINFDGEGCRAVREYFIANAHYWIDEYHLDGLRLDATQQIFDESKPNIMLEVCDAARSAAGRKSVVVIGENEPQLARLVRSRDDGGYELDALWNDDFHHSAVVALTGRNEAYYTDYRGSPGEFLAAIKWGFLYQGQHYKWQRKRRGAAALDVPPFAFVHFLENHDQIANSGRGSRLISQCHPGRYRALTALLLLSPQTPMLFQGQEFGATSPFLYFADHGPSLVGPIHEGRKKSLGQFPSLATSEAVAVLAPPHHVETFEQCKLNWDERVKNRESVVLHRDLITLRREDPVFSRQNRSGLDGAILSPSAFLLRHFSPEYGDRLLLVNLGGRQEFDVVPEPLLAPPRDREWQLAWSSESVTYGGCGTPAVEEDGRWSLPAESAIVLMAVRT